MQDALFEPPRVFVASATYSTACGWCKTNRVPHTGGITPLPGHETPVWWAICHHCFNQHGTPKETDTITVRTP